MLHATTTVLLLLAFLCKYIPPSTFWLLATLSYLVPILLLVQLGMVCFFVIQKRWKSLAMAICAILLHTPNMYITFAMPKWQNTKDPSAKVDFSVLSYNTQAFNLYGDGKTHQMLDWLSKDIADVKCFQEYHESNRPPFSEIRKKMLTNTPYFLIDTCFINKRNDVFGLAVFSKYPIIHFEKSILHPQSVNNAFLIDIDMNGRTVQILNIHFTSVGIPMESQQWFNVLQVIQNGFLLRQKELEKLLQVIRKSPHPIIVCGDFNDVPYGYAYHKIRQHLKNSFEESGSGLGFTYSSEYPLLRIDNQFISQELIAVKLEVLDNIYYTDHLPILGHYRWSNSPDIEVAK